MSELFVKSGTLQLWTESFGNPTNSPILLIWGSDGQGIMWPDEFCNKLVQANFFVIRYDNRDTGLSSIVDYDTSPYTLDDMAKDAIAILDAYNITKAHIVGSSMGGFIGQLLAINYPERVASLVSIASSPDKPILFGKNEDLTNKSDLPSPDSEFLDFLASESAKKPVTRQDYINQEVRIWRACNGGGIDFDEEIVRAQQTTAFNRINLANASATENHMHAIERSNDRTIDLKRITAPTLVVHGDKDPLLPLEHGIATAKNISNASLVIIKDMGHIFPFARSNYLASVITDHALISCITKHGSSRS